MVDSAVYNRFMSIKLARIDIVAFREMEIPDKLKLIMDSFSIVNDRLCKKNRFGGITNSQTCGRKLGCRVENGKKPRVGMKIMQL